MKPSFATLLLALSLLTAACDDPAGVGVELIDNRSGAPEVEQLPAPLVPGQPVYDITFGASRFVMGAVNDPVVGGTRAAALLSFEQSSSSAVQTDAMQSVELVLVRNYRYGDTTSTVQFAVKEVIEDYRQTRGTSSSAIATGPTLTTVALSAADTHRISLPADWLTRNLQSVEDNLQPDVLHPGLLIEPVTEGMIFGMSTSGSDLVVVSGGDTTYFVVSPSMSLISRTTDGNPGPGLTVLQDGPGSGTGVEFDLDGAGLADVAVSRAILSIPYDTIALSHQLPPNFVRPALTQVDLVGIERDSTSEILATANVQGGMLVFENEEVRSTIQNLLINRSRFEAFALMGHCRRFSLFDARCVENTVSTLALKDGSAGDGVPTIVLTVIKPATL